MKTSTGFSSSGATVHDVELMRSAVGPDMGVKASGGIRDCAMAAAMFAAFAATFLVYWIALLSALPALSGARHGA